MKRLICCILICVLICSNSMLAISASNWTDFEDGIVFTGFDHDEFFDNELSIPNQEEINCKFLTNYFSTYYFANQTANYGLNTKGTCCYVSIDMLLSYYDTYWDDSIIPEQYDQITQMPYNDFSYLVYTENSISSPGTRRESFEMSNKDMGTAEYFQSCEQYANSYYHMYLITLGNELGYYNWNATADEYPCALNFSKTLNLLNAAMPDHLTDKLSVYYTQTNVRDTAIDLIQQGFPVILFVRGDRDTSDGVQMSNHAYIAYDYSVALDTIYGHIGGTYMNAPHNSPAGVGYDMDETFEYSGLITVLPQANFNHNCSNNYQYTLPGSNETISHCPCELSIHPEFIASPHIHDDYMEVCEDWHTYNCETCESSGIEEPHDFIPQQGAHLEQDEHLLVCHCGYVSYGYCSYNSIARPYNDLTHRKYCACGAYESYYHAFVSAPTSASYNWICIGCGATSNSTTMPTPQSLVSGDVMMQMNSSGVITLPDGTTLQILTETGSYVLSNGVIVLSPEDAALVEAGLLDPYELVESVTVPAGPGHVTE